MVGVVIKLRGCVVDSFFSVTAAYQAGNPSQEVKITDILYCERVCVCGFSVTLNSL